MRPARLAFLAALALATALGYPRGDATAATEASVPSVHEAPSAPEPVHVLFHPPGQEPTQVVAQLALQPEDADDAEATVHGWVHGDRGEVFENVSLNAEREDLSIEYDDTDGSFTAHGPAGSFALVARAEGRLPARLDGLTLAKGEEVREVELVLAAGLSLQGIVRSDEGPVAGTRVTAEATGYLLSAYSDDNGHFEIPGAPPGHVTVRAYDEAQGTARVETHAGDTSVDLHVRRDGKLRGRVLSASGAPVEGAMIFTNEANPLAQARDHDPYGDTPNCMMGDITGFGACGPMPGCLSKTNTDDVGRFELEVPRDARVVVMAQEGSAVATATADTTEDGFVELRLADPKRVRVRVHDSEGEPVATSLSARTNLWTLAPADRDVEVGEDGNGVLEVVPGVPLTIEAGGNRIEFPDGQPANVTVSEPIDESDVPEPASMKKKRHVIVLDDLILE